MGLVERLGDREVDDDVAEELETLVMAPGGVSTVERARNQTDIAGGKR